MKLLGTYKNGTYTVSIYDDGTKIREGKEFIASFPENIDLKITNKCDLGCPMCHEKSTIDGKEGNLLNEKFIESLHPFTEIAIGGGNALSHKDLVPFLKKLKERHIIANLTVNQTHFLLEKDFIMSLINEELIYGIGVSVFYPNEDLMEILEKIPNAVVHLIAGIATKETFEKMYDKNLKILLLGYKDFGRGENYKLKYSKSITENMEYLKNNLPKISKHFAVISFDNLALKQLEVEKFLTPKMWEEFYMGDDGSHTMYIDLVERKFGKNSTAKVRYELKDTIEEMFEVVKNE